MRFCVDWSDERGEWFVSDSNSMHAASGNAPMISEEQAALVGLSAVLPCASRGGSRNLTHCRELAKRLNNYDRAGAKVGAGVPPLPAGAPIDHARPARDAAPDAPDGRGARGAGDPFGGSGGGCIEVWAENYRAAAFAALDAGFIRPELADALDEALHSRERE